MPITTIALKALENIGGPAILLAAVPGGSRALAKRAGVSVPRVSQVLRQNPFPPKWASMLAELINCTEWEVYHQLGQEPPVSRDGPLFDVMKD